MLCAPYFDKQRATEFIRQCNQRWPLIESAFGSLFQWMVGSMTGYAQRDNTPNSRESFLNPQQFPCGQWFDLHVLNNGFVTKYCIDETGYFSDIRYDARVNDLFFISGRQRSRRIDLPPRYYEPECRGSMRPG